MGAGASSSTSAGGNSGAAAASSSSIASSRAEAPTEPAQSGASLSMTAAKDSGAAVPVVKVVEASEPESATITMAAESAAAAAYFESGYAAAAAYIANAESLSAVKSVGEASHKPSSQVYDEMLAAKLGAIGDLSTAEPRPGAMQDEKTDAPASNESLYQEAAAAYSFIMM